MLNPAFAEIDQEEKLREVDYEKLCALVADVLRDGEDDPAKKALVMQAEQEYNTVTRDVLYKGRT